MASELASARQAEARAGARRGVVNARTASSLARTMLCDLERVRAALRAGAQPQVYGIDGLTKRAKQPDTIAHGPDGDALILVRHGRVTMLGRMWDEQMAAKIRSRRPHVKRREEPVQADSKGLNGPMLPLRRGNATEPCAQVVR